MDMKEGLSCPYCDYGASASMRADLNLWQHMRDKHGSSEEEIKDVLRDFYEDEEKLARERFKCPRCGGRNFSLRIKCTITADVRNMEVLDWGISHLFYTTLTCRDCEAGEPEDTSFFYDFDELPRSIKSGIFNV